MEKKDTFVLRHLAEVQPELWWLDSDPLEPDPHPALIGDLGADLCIVGGGYTGLWTALLAKERDPHREVVVVEQYETGAGASGRNGGFCSASLTHGFTNGMNRFPREMPVIERLARENLDEIEATISATTSSAIGSERVSFASRLPRGSLRACSKRRDCATRWVTTLKSSPRTKCSRESTPPRMKARSSTSTGRRSSILHASSGDSSAPASRSACKIFENSKVEWLEDVEHGVRVHTPYGAVTAAKVALATNVFPSLIRQTRKYVAAVYDYALVTEPLSDEQMASIGWAHREGVADSGNQFHYYRLTKDNSILWGGYDTIYKFRGKGRRDLDFNAETYAKLAGHFLTTFPQLAGIKFTHAWGGAIDTCTRFSPFWGMAHGKKVAYVMGYTGLGVASTRFGASVMLDLLDEKTTERTMLTMVRKKPMPFPPEPLRWLFIRWTQHAIERADEHEGRRGLWLRLLDLFNLGFDS